MGHSSISITITIWIDSSCNEAWIRNSFFLVPRLGSVSVSSFGRFSFGTVILPLVDEAILVLLLQDGRFWSFLLIAWCAQLINVIGKMNWKWNQYKCLLFSRNIFSSKFDVFSHCVNIYLSQKWKTGKYEPSAFVFTPFFRAIRNRRVSNDIRNFFRHRNDPQVHGEKQGKW